MFGVFWCKFALDFCHSKGILENRQIEKNVIIWWWPPPVPGSPVVAVAVVARLNITPQRKGKRKKVTPIFKYYTSRKRKRKS